MRKSEGLLELRRISSSTKRSTSALTRVGVIVVIVWQCIDDFGVGSCYPRIGRRRFQHEDFALVMIRHSFGAEASLSNVLREFWRGGGSEANQRVDGTIQLRILTARI